MSVSERQALRMKHKLLNVCYNDANNPNKYWNIQVACHRFEDSHIIELADGHVVSIRSREKAHRAYLVNLQRIKAVIQFTRNSYTLQLNDPQETMIPLSKQGERILQELLGS